MLTLEEVEARIPGEITEEMEAAARKLFADYLFVRAEGTRRYAWCTRERREVGGHRTQPVRLDPSGNRLDALALEKAVERAQRREETLAAARRQWLVRRVWRPCVARPVEQVREE